MLQLEDVIVALTLELEPGLLCLEPRLRRLLLRGERRPRGDLGQFDPRHSRFLRIRSSGQLEFSGRRSMV